MKRNLTQFKHWRTVVAFCSAFFLLNAPLPDVIGISFVNSIKAQIRVEPAFPAVADNITLTYDATLGNATLNTTSPVYIHTGVLTTTSANSSDWKYTKYPWTTNAADNVLTALGSAKHSISYNIQSYYGIPASGVTATKLALVFRSADGSKVGKTTANGDIFWDIWDGTTFDSKFVVPYQTPINVNVGDAIPIEVALSQVGNLQIRVDGSLVASGSGVTSKTYTIASALPGLHTVTLNANDGTTTLAAKTIQYYAAPSVTVQNPPSGYKIGATDNGDGTATFVLRAPGKSFVYCLGSFNNYAFDNTSLMKRSTDGNTFWLTVSGLTAGQNYLYQYFVGDAASSVRVADPYSRIILDPSNDSYISSTIYPNLPTYPTGNKTTGAVTIFEYGKTPYSWTTGNVRPNKSDLVIYELLVRDYTTKKTFQGVIDSLQYLKDLGINAIEIMPVHEFEGNDSWGYNPDYYMAADKAYGTRDKLKQLIDLAHQKGIAVILDVAFNHVYSLAPICQMYWDAANLRPTANNPWVNQIATHPFSPGYDLNHESTWTKEYCKDAFRYWLEEFRFDGFRIDLSKGFTQTNCGSDLNCWNQYDQSRINILTDYYNHIQSVSSGAYMICEHLGSSSEENALCANGMMVWQKQVDPYKQAAMAYSSGSDLSGFSPKSGSWPSPQFDRPVTFGESHDEERAMYECLTNGNQYNGYSTRTLSTTLRRMELMAAFFYTIPGAKMLWQFGEMGYDYSINSQGGRVSAKPPRWDYLSQADRLRLYKVVANIINLRTQYPSVFRTNNHNPYDINASASQAWYHKHFHLSPGGSDFDVTILGNFDVVTQSLPAYFQGTGTWYDYLAGTTLNVTNASMSFTLQPGEYHIWTRQKITPPQGLTPWSSAIPVELVSFSAKNKGNDV